MTPRIYTPVSAQGDPRNGNAFSRYLGLRFEDPGTVRLELRPDLLNDAGLLLGPVAVALIDYAMGCALWAQTTEDENIATVNIAINYIQSAADGEVVCHAKVDRRNRRFAVLSAKTHHEDGRLLATAIGSWTIFPPRRQS